MTPEHIWETCRTINTYAAILAALGVAFRLAVLLLDRARWRDTRARHLTLWFVYIAGVLIVASRGSAHYERVGAPASPWSAVSLLLTFMAIALCAWWPHPRRFVPIEENTHGPRT